MRIALILASCLAALGHIGCGQIWEYENLGQSCRSNSDCDARQVCVKRVCRSSGADADTDADSDTDSDLDTDSDTDTDFSCGSEVCFDHEHDLAWQLNLPAGTYTWDDASAYCSALSMVGYPDWRLPAINEQRALIRGCAPTEPGGPCGVTDGCVTASCRNVPCDGCTSDEGPAAGCYWPAQLGPTCARPFWSSTTVASATGEAWYTVFNSGVINRGSKGASLLLRCVHDL